jgi:Tol biopolymer transport system component
MLTTSGLIAPFLEKVLTSAEFSRAKRMARFLRFVVEETLAGRGEELKERQIGIEVFDRDLDWDPKVDNIVRSEARRLRGKLDIYYASVGKADSIRIIIPKGAYAAEFQEINQPPQSQSLENELHDVFPPSTRALDVPPAARSTLPHWGRFVAGIVSIAVFLPLLAHFMASRHASARAREDGFEVLPFANEIGQEFSPAVSPDKKRIAYTWDGNKGNYDIYIKDVGNGTVSRLTEDAFVELNPAWSPDGRRIAFLRIDADRAHVIVKDTETGKEQLLTDTASPISTWLADSNPFFGCYGPAWSPDGWSMVVADQDGAGRAFGLYRVALNTGAREQLTAPPGVERDTCPHFSPSGDRIAFVRYVSHGLSELHSMKADGSDQKQLTFDRRTIRGLDWAGDGRQLLFSSLRQGAFQLRAIDRNGGESHLLPVSTTSAVDPSIAGNENWLAFTELEENWNIWRVRLTPNGMARPELLLSSTGKNHSPMFSPDGSHIAFVSDRSGSPEIWLANEDGSNLKKLTNFGGPWLGSIRWSPDGHTLAFDARPAGHSGIFLMPAAGGAATPFEENGFEERRPTWSHDGQSIYFNSNRGGSLQIWRKSLATGKISPIGPVDTNESTESDDGRFLVFSNSAYELWRCKSDGTGAERLVSDLHPEPGLDWSLAHDGIYFATHQQEESAVFFYRFSDRKLRRVGAPEKAFAPGTPSMAVSPDGKWLIYAQLDHVSSDIKIRSAKDDSDRHERLSASLPSAFSRF